MNLRHRQITTKFLLKKRQVICLQYALSFKNATFCVIMYRHVMREMIDISQVVKLCDKMPEHKNAVNTLILTPRVSLDRRKTIMFWLKNSLLAKTPTSREVKSSPFFNKKNVSYSQFGKPVQVLRGCMARSTHNAASGAAGPSNKLLIN